VALHLKEPNVVAMVRRLGVGGDALVGAAGASDNPAHAGEGGHEPSS
jgi:hypothetical protein